MALSIVHGPPNSGRAGVVRRRFMAVIGQDPVLVVPTFDDVVAFGRELCPEGGALLGGTVTTFDGLFREVSAATESNAPPELTKAQRLQLFSAAIEKAHPRLLRASSRRPGFVPALEELVTELQATEVAPERLAGGGGDLGGSALLAEIADLYAAYVTLRNAAGRGDAYESAARAISALNFDHDAWRRRPVVVYGFDDLTGQQLSLVQTLAPITDVTVAITYEDREALGARSSLLERLRDTRDRTVGLDEVTPADPANTASPLLHAVERGFLVEGAARSAPDPSLRLLRCAGDRAEAEAVGGEVAKLLADGAAPDSIAIAVRDPHMRGPLLGSVLSAYGIPVAVEAELPVTATATGSALVGLLHAAQPGGTADDILAFLRAPGQGTGANVDSLERRLRRDAKSDGATAEAVWRDMNGKGLGPLEDLRDAGSDRRAVLKIAAEAALDLSQWPVKREGRQGEVAGADEALELRAGAAIADALDEICELDACRPEPSALAGLIEAMAFPLWSGPATGRVRVASPYKLRAARFAHVFVVSLQDGEFPSHRSGGPFLSDEQRAAAGLRERIDSELEERYLFHSCLSLPTHHLYLSHRYCDDEGKTLAPSPYLDEVGSLLQTGDDESGATADPLEALYETRSLADVVFPPSAAPSPSELARSLAVERRTSAPEPLALTPDLARHMATVLLEAEAYDPEPGPLTAEPILEKLGSAKAYGGTTLEQYASCSYRWFVGHELSPQLLDPAPDQLVYGGAIHKALEDLYRNPPVPGTRPTHETIEVWVTRGRELLEAQLGESSPGASAAARIGRRRLLDFIEDYLVRDSKRTDTFEPAILEGAFGLDRVEGTKPALEFDGWELHGSIDRVDVDAARGLAIVHDYKVGSTVIAQKRFERDQRVQLALYMIAVDRLWDRDPVAGMYHPLGKGRRAVPRGLGRKSDLDDSLAELGLAGTDWVDDETFDERLDKAEDLATSIVERMRSGDITRDPLEGRCPPFCTFAPICRLDRRAEASGEQAGRDQAGE